MLTVHAKYRGTAVSVSVPRSATAFDLATALSTASEAVPPPERQKLLCRGRQLKADASVTLGELTCTHASLSVMIVDAPPPAPPSPSLTLRYLNGAALRAFETSAEATVSDVTKQAKAALRHHFALGEDALAGPHVLYANGQVLEPRVRLSAYGLPAGAPLYLLPSHGSMLGDLRFGTDASQQHALTQAAHMLQQCAVKSIVIDSAAAAAAAAEPRDPPAAAASSGMAGANSAHSAGPPPAVPSVPATMRSGLRPPPAAVAPATQPIMSVLLSHTDPVDGGSSAADGAVPGGNPVGPDAPPGARAVSAAALSAAEAELGRRLESLVGELVRARGSARAAPGAGAEDSHPLVDLGPLSSLGAAVMPASARADIGSATSDASNEHYAQLVARIEKAYPTPAAPAPPSVVARPARPPPIRATSRREIGEAAAPSGGSTAPTRAQDAERSSPTAPTVRGLRRGFLGGRARARKAVEREPRPPSPPKPTVRGLRKGFLTARPSGTAATAAGTAVTVAGSGGQRQRLEPRAPPPPHADANSGASRASQQAAPTLKRPLERGEKDEYVRPQPNAKMVRSGASTDAAAAAAADKPAPSCTGRPVCACCSRRLPLVASLTAKCRCGELYCAMHADPRAHGCTYDYRSAARVALSEKLTSAIASRSADGMARSA